MKLILLSNSRGFRVRNDAFLFNYRDLRAGDEAYLVT